MIGPSENKYRPMPGREMDALAAQVVKGYTLDYEFAESMGEPTVKDLRDQYDEWGILPNYSTDMTAAWSLDRPGWLWEFKETVNGLVARLIWQVDNDWTKAHARETFPLWADFPSKSAAYAWARCQLAIRAFDALDMAHMPRSIPIGEGQGR